MDTLWLTPSAWWGLAALVVPIAIHLLTRQQTRRIPFPTLRFLHATRLAALRRRSIHDWPLLLVRLAILAAAVAALAGPVFVSEARSVEWQTRVARAIVVAPAAAAEGALERLISDEAATSFSNAVFRPPAYLADGVRDAADWLHRQPPAAREIVIVGDLKEGALTAADLTLAPPPVGVRFMPLPAAGNPAVTLDFASGRTTVTALGTRVDSKAGGYNRADATAADRIGVRAAREQLAFAEAARDAVIARGVEIGRARDRRLVVVFDGSDSQDLQLKQPADERWMRDALARLPGVRGGQQGDTLVVLLPLAAEGLAAVHAIDRVARAAFADDFHALEVRRLSPAVLAGWSRPPQPVTDAPVSDEGDRRWFWAAALVLLAIESLIRRSSPPANIEEHPLEEPRVA